MTETRRTAARLEARFAPTSIDAMARTVEVVWSTGAPVPRRDWDGEYIEELDMSPEAVDLSRLNNGAPVLDSHQGEELEDVIGVVERAWLAEGEGRAVLRFSDRPEVAPIFADIQAGILRNISVGYRVDLWRETRGADGMKIRRAVRWQPAEISVVPVPADASAQIRAAVHAPAEVVSPSPTDAAVAAEESIMTEVASAPVSAAPVNITEVRAAERTRISELRQVATLAGSSLLAPEVAANLEAAAVESGATAEQLRSQLFEAAIAAGSNVRAPAPRSAVTMGRSGDDPAALIDAMGTALAVRAMPAMATTADQRFREFAALKPSDMMLELLAARGEHISPRQRSQFAERAFHTSSDFPMLLENAGNKMLEAGFSAAAPSYRQFFGQRSFNDFKAHTFLTAGDFPAPQELGEGGEIKGGTISEKRERITPKTYARSVGVTRQMLVNDDLGAFSDFGAMIGRRIADYENSLAYSMVETASGAGPTLLEGAAAVFTTGRGNKASTGTAITEGALDAGYAGIQNATSLDGIKLNLQPRYLLTGTAYRGAALRYTAPILAATGSSVSLYTDLIPIADANITGNRWYMFADPAAAQVYVYGYVNGQSAPQVRVHQYVPGTDGILVEVVHDFAVGAIGYRGAWFNAGA